MSTQRSECSQTFVAARVTNITRAFGFASVVGHEIFFHINDGKAVMVQDGALVYDESRKINMPAVGSMINVLLCVAPKGYEAGVWCHFDNYNGAMFKLASAGLPPVERRAAPKQAPQQHFQPKGRNQDRRPQGQGRNQQQRNGNRPERQVAPPAESLSAAADCEASIRRLESLAAESANEVTAVCSVAKAPDAVPAE